MWKLKNNTSTYRHPSEESNSETVWNARNDNNITRPYDQIPDETYTEDALIEAIDNPKAYEEPYEETYDVEKVDKLIKEEDFWWLEKYLLKFPEGSEYVQFHYPEYLKSGVNKEYSSEWIEDRYPEYFPKKWWKKITEALVENFEEEKDFDKEPHSVQKKWDNYLESQVVQNNFYRKWTPKKDRRHWKEDIGKKDRRTNQNRRRRKEIKKDLKDLLVA